MRQSDDEFLDKCAIEAMGGLLLRNAYSNGATVFDSNGELIGFETQDETCCKKAFQIAAAMVQERKRLMDEQKKTKVSEKFGKLPEVE